MGWTVFNSDGQILQSAGVSDNAITTAKILDNAVTVAKLATSAITGAPDLGEAPATGDSLLISDTSASAALKEITIANLFTAPAITGNATAVTQSASNNSTRIATTAYVDAQVATEDTIAEMGDVTLSSIGSGEVLKWNGSAWVNNTIAELGVLPVANPTFTGNLIVGSATVTEAQLEILDGATVTTAELNLLDALDRGSIVYGNSSGATTVLGQGSADTVLTSDGTDIAWQAAAAGGISAAQMMAYESPPEFIADIGSNPGVAKGWCRIQPGGTLTAGDYNVASITDHQNGVRTIVWDVDFADAEYSVVGSINDTSVGNLFAVFDDNNAVGSVGHNIYNNGVSLIDEETCVVAFGEQ